MTGIQEIVDRDWFMLVSVRQIAEAMNKPNVWVVNQFLKDKINGEPGKHTPVLYASKGRRGYKAFYSDVRDFLDNRMQSE